MAKGTPSTLDTYLLGAEEAQRRADVRATEEQTRQIKRLADESAAQRRATTHAAAEQTRLLEEQNRLLEAQIANQAAQARRMEPVRPGELYRHGLDHRAAEIRTQGQLEDELLRRRRAATAEVEREFAEAADRRLTDAEAVVLRLPDRPTVREAKARLEQRTAARTAAEQRLAKSALVTETGRQDRIEAILVALLIPFFVAGLGWLMLPLGIIAVAVACRTDFARFFGIGLVIVSVLLRSVTGLYEWNTAGILAVFALLYARASFVKERMRVDADAQDRLAAHALLDAETRADEEAMHEIKAITLLVHPTIKQFHTTRAGLRLVWTHTPRSVAVAFQEMLFRTNARQDVFWRLHQFFEEHPAWADRPHLQRAELDRCMEGFGPWYRDRGFANAYAMVNTAEYLNTITLPSPDPGAPTALPGGTPVVPENVPPAESSPAPAIEPSEDFPTGGRFSRLG